MFLQHINLPHNPYIHSANIVQCQNAKLEFDDPLPQQQIISKIIYIVCVDYCDNCTNLAVWL